MKINQHNQLIFLGFPEKFFSLSHFCPMLILSALVRAVIQLNFISNKRITRLGKRIVVFVGSCNLTRDKLLVLAYSSLGDLGVTADFLLFTSGGKNKIAVVAWRQICLEEQSVRKMETSKDMRLESSRYVCNLYVH